MNRTVETSGYGRGEEMANTASAALGLLAVLVLGPFLMGRAAASGSTPALMGVMVFCAAVAFLYLASTLYHAAPEGRAKRAIRVFDHAAIFILIAGTYTPFALQFPGGRTLLVLEWVLALAGIAFKVFGGMRHRWISNALYLGMGWLGVFWLGPVIDFFTLPAFLWMVAGGMAYTAGTVFYVMKHRAYTHFVWHLFVFAGTCLHGWAIARYAIPE